MHVHSCIRMYSNTHRPAALHNCMYVQVFNQMQVHSPSSSMSVGSGLAGLVSGLGSISPGRSFRGSSSLPSPSFICALSLKHIQREWKVDVKVHAGEKEMCKTAVNCICTKIQHVHTHTHTHTHTLTATSHSAPSTEQESCR